MKKLSSRAVAALTNCCLAFIVLVIGIVCFFPSVTAASKVDERAIYRGRSENALSLMVNVYWGTQTVYDMLNVFEEYGVKVTFFLGGCWADDNVDCVKKIVECGHEIGSHGYFHREHDKLSLQANVNEIKTSVDFLNKASGVEIKLFAPPSGAYNETTLSAAQSLGLKTILWSKDTIDWRDKDEDLCYKRATEGVKGGELILMHPMEHTLKALPKILSYYREHNLAVIPVGENLQENT